ncbi:MAG: aminopeptidase [Candidatus Woesearchaeota archaeon]
MDIHETYAHLIVNFFINEYKGIQPNQVVVIDIPESAKPLLVPLQTAVLKAGAHPLIMYRPDGITRHFFEHAQNHQLSFYAQHFYEGLVSQIDHGIYIRAEADKKELQGITPSKIMQKMSALLPYRQLRDAKENAGKFTWTLCSYPTESVAKEAGVSLQKYWDLIIKACYLDVPHPIATWKEVITHIETTKQKLNALDIQQLHVKSASTDITIGLGGNRKWLGGSGRNLPSYELFISPHWQHTNGYIQFTEPLYLQGTLLKKVYLAFKDGVVTKATAQQGQEVLDALLAIKNANKVGEFSLTDARVSPITTFMADTLFDENVQGNTHLALGNAYKDSYPNNPATVSNWDELGYNESAAHVDIVSTEPRIVTATLKDGSQKIIYEHDRFVV